MPESQQGNNGLTPSDKVRLLELAVKSTPGACFCVCPIPQLEKTGETSFTGKNDPVDFESQLLFAVAEIPDGTIDLTLFADSGQALSRVISRTDIETLIGILTRCVQEPSQS